MGEPEPPLVTPERTETNLTITKSAGPSEATASGQNTPFTITVTNEGPGAFNGPIEVLDTLFDGATVEPSNGSWSAPWTCEGQSLAGHPEQGICTHPPVELDPGESVVLDLEIEAPNSFVAPSGSQVKCSYKNKVEILDPPGGSPQNTNAGDDVDFAEARFEPFEKHGTSFCELGLTTPPPSCPQGWSQTPIPGKCCPPRTKWDGQQCQRGAPPPKEKCPPNSDGAYKYPDCRCEPGYAGTPPNCKRVVVPPKECPKGYIGTPPNCERVVVPPKECPKGYIGTPPNCERVVVPPKECPKGYVGTPPNCKRVVVPPRSAPKARAESIRSASRSTARKEREVSTLTASPSRARKVRRAGTRIASRSFPIARKVRGSSTGSACGSPFLVAQNSCSIAERASASLSRRQQPVRVPRASPARRRTARGCRSSRCCFPTSSSAFSRTEKPIILDEVRPRRGTRTAAR